MNEDRHRLKNELEDMTEIANAHQKQVETCRNEIKDLNNDIRKL